MVWSENCMVWSEIVWFQIMNLMVWAGSGVGKSAIDSRCSLLIDYDEKHDWWFSDDNWSWLMNDDKGHRWWFIVIDNEVMDDKWLTDLLIDDKIMIMITKSVIIPAVSGLYRPTGLLLKYLEKFHLILISSIRMLGEIKFLKSQTA